MNKTLVLSLSVLSLANVQAMNNKDACESSRSFLKEAEQKFTRQIMADLLYLNLPSPNTMTAHKEFISAMNQYIACLNKQTRSLYKTGVSKTEKVEETCSAQRSQYETMPMDLDLVPDHLEIALQQYEACQKRELAKLYEEKKQKNNRYKQ